MGQTRKLLVGASVAGAAALIALLFGFAGWRAKRALRLAKKRFRRNESCALKLTHLLRSGSQL